MAFIKANGIDMATEIDGNPFEGLSTEEINKVKSILKTDNIIIE